MFDPLLTKIARAFEKEGIPYMVIGGQAVNLYGRMRLTEDVDITLGMDISERQEVLSVLNALQFQALVPDIDEFIMNTYILPVRDQESGIDVDFAFSGSPYERQAIERAAPVNISGTDVFFATPEDLIIHKMIAGRARDHEDVRTVLVKQLPGLDLEYVKDWLRRFQEALGHSYVAEFAALIEKAD